MGKEVKTSALPEVVRWSANRKKEVVLRLLRGESIDALSRELGVEVYRLEEWHRKALHGVEAALKERRGDPVQAELDSALRRLGEVTMENELLQYKVRKSLPLAPERSKR